MSLRFWFKVNPPADGHIGRSLGQLIGLVLSCALLFLGTASAQTSYKVSPSSLSITAGAYVGTASVPKAISITNTGTTTFTVSNFSISPSQFQLYYGFAPITLPPGQVANFSIVFVPTSATTVNGQFKLTVSGVADPIVINLTGTGTMTDAVAKLSPSTLNFGNVRVGTVSPPQTVTITNTGATSRLSIRSISADPPFTVIGAQLVVLNPGKSTSFQVTFTGTGKNTFSDVLVVQYLGIPASAVDLTGTGTAPATLTINTYPTLPSATQSAAYTASLSAPGGMGPLAWRLASGSTLPLGLSLAGRGVISGTLDPSVAAGKYSFSVSVMDSNTPPSTATAQLTLPVGAPTGASCNNISWPLADAGPALLPITDLGTGLYLGSEGGLYPGGSNLRPASHSADGVAIAQGIRPLDANGNPDPNGKYALLSIGNSVAFDDFAQFMVEANADPMKDPHLVFVPGAQPRAGASDFAVSQSPFWSEIRNYFLPQSGVTANQVVAAWVMDVIGEPTGTFPSDMTSLQADLERIAGNLHTFFPNLKLAYFTSRYYGGYSYGLRDPADTEPYAYESGFAVKWAIADQLNGLAALNYNPTRGPVRAPWMSWAHYDWANGLLARKDGLVWTCQDQQSDGIHPSNPAGRTKDTNLMLNFFKTDATTVPWFLAHGAN